MPVDPHFLDMKRRTQSQPHENSRLHVRLDVPGGVTFAPDQLNPHNSNKRVFFVPRLPEPDSLMHNFDKEIAEHNGVPYVPHSAFVLDDEDLSPAQRMAQEVREQNASKDEVATQLKNLVLQGDEQENAKQDMSAPNDIRSEDSIPDKPEEAKLLKAEDPEPGTVKVEKPNTEESLEPSENTNAEKNGFQETSLFEESEKSEKSREEIKDESKQKAQEEAKRKCEEPEEKLGEKYEQLASLEEKSTTEDNVESAKPIPKKTEQTAENESAEQSDAKDAQYNTNEKSQDKLDHESEETVHDDTRGAAMKNEKKSDKEDSSITCASEKSDFELKKDNTDKSQEPCETPAKPALFPTFDASSAGPSDTFSIQTAETGVSMAPTISGFSVMANEAKHGRSDGLPAVVRDHLKVVDFKVPPSISQRGNPKRPWDTESYKTYRSTESLSAQPKGRDSGTQWREVSGYGNEPLSSHAGDPRAVTFDTLNALFVPDPRPWHPYRFVRRTNPRQVLLMCAGTALTQQQLQTSDLARKVASGQISPIQDAKSLASYFGTTENTTLQGGVGFVYSPTEPLCRAMHERVDETRVEGNFSRRLERPEFPHETTKRRAALRSVIAALEYVRWEKEGFDKIVIATHHGWIVRGIAYEYVH